MTNYQPCNGQCPHPALKKGHIVGTDQAVACSTLTKNRPGPSGKASTILVSQITPNPITTALRDLPKSPPGPIVTFIDSDRPESVPTEWPNPFNTWVDFVKPYINEDGSFPEPIMVRHLPPREDDMEQYALIYAATVPEWREAQDWYVAYGLGAIVDVPDMANSSDDYVVGMPEWVELGIESEKTDLLQHLHHDNVPIIPTKTAKAAAITGALADLSPVDGGKTSWPFRKSLAVSYMMGKRDQSYKESYDDLVDMGLFAGYPADTNSHPVTALKNWAAKQPGAPVGNQEELLKFAVNKRTDEIRYGMSEWTAAQKRQIFYSLRPDSDPVKKPPLSWEDISRLNNKRHL